MIYIHITDIKLYICIDTYLRVCVRACARVFVCACARVRVRGPGRVLVRVCAWVCAREVFHLYRILCGLYRLNMESGMEKKLENEMETRVV